MEPETSPHVDRRIQRTRRLLGDALIGLIVERGYDELTIKDVTDRADVAYVTFFRHYRSLNELLAERLAETIAQTTAEVSAIAPNDAAWYTPEGGLRIFEVVGENAALFRILLTSAGALAVRRQVQEMIAATVLRNCAALLAETQPLPPEVAANHLAASQLSLLEWWLVHDQPYPAREMAAIYTQMVVLPTFNITPDKLDGLAGR